MSESDHCAVVAGAIGALRQGMTLLGAIDNKHYTCSCEPCSTSTIGEHFRHALDMFLQLKKGANSGLVDYDTRRRGAPLESDSDKAQAEMDTMINWLQQIDTGSGGADFAVQVKAEVCLTETRSVMIPSSFLRELAFVASHAVHHYAIITVLARFLGNEIDESMGVAPATASYRRSRAVCAQ